MKIWIEVNRCLNLRFVSCGNVDSLYLAGPAWSGRRQGVLARHQSTEPISALPQSRRLHSGSGSGIAEDNCHVHERRGMNVGQFSGQ